jgi:hypothetical protein
VLTANVAPLDDTDPFQLLQALRRQRLRHQGYTAPHIAEAGAAGQQFMDDSGVHRSATISAALAIGQN